MANSTENKTKTGLYINDNILESLRYIEYKENKTRTELVNQSLTEFIKKWEQKNGQIPKK